MKKIKRFRWWVLGVIALITLNYLWVANIRVNYKVAEFPGQATLPYAIYSASTHQYTLFNTDKTTEIVDEKKISVIPSGAVEYIHKGGIAYQLGLIDYSDTEEVTASKQKRLYVYTCLFFIVAGWLIKKATLRPNSGQPI